MSGAETGELLLLLAILFGLTFALGGLLEKVRIPSILGALFVAMAAHYTPLGTYLTQPPLHDAFTFLAQLGVLFLLLFIGLQIDLQMMKSLSHDIIWLTVLNTAVPFILGIAVMLGMGYGWVLAFIIGLTRMPTAEAVIVPILDEFQLIRTRVGQFIVGAGVLDDVIEVFLVALVSVWIGNKATGVMIGAENEILHIILSILIFLLLAWLSYRWIIPFIADWLPRRQSNLLLLAVLVLFGFGGFSEYANIGMVVGAIVAGVLLQPAFTKMAVVGEQTTQTIRAISYGFFAPVFFFWVGLSVDINGILDAPTLAILLYLAGTIGKLAGVFLMVPMKKLTTREAWTIGVGLDARMTTEIIVAKLLLDAQLIDLHLFTALVAAASFTAITVPLAFTLLVRKWGDQLRDMEQQPTELD